MTKVYKLIKDMDSANLKHLRNHKRLKNMSQLDILKSASSELIELSYVFGSNNSKLEELADLLAVLLHYAVRCGFSVNQIQKRMIEKLCLRYGDKVKELLKRL